MKHAFRIAFPLMQTYLVGGAVRDELLGLEVRERDWLVTGVTADDLLAQGFRPVGREFEVFLHPDTAEEYSLPRGHREMVAGDDRHMVEDDLRRRDLTINALARAPDGSLIDPLNGAADIKHRLLRHTPAFADDPIRILRLARFSARYHRQGFVLAPETRCLAKDLIRAGALDDAVPERIWAEWVKALAGPAPWLFVDQLRELGTLAVLAPEIDRLFGVPQPAQHHPEIDTGVHSLMVLEQAARLSDDPRVRFAALVHDLGKGTTPKAKWPRHIGHESRGAHLVDQLCERLRCPSAWRQLARLGARLHLKAHRALDLKAATVLSLFNELDAFRNPAQLQDFLLVCKADALGRKGMECNPYPPAEYLASAWRAANQIRAVDVIQPGMSGEAIGRRIAGARTGAIQSFRENWPKT